MRSFLEWSHARDLRYPAELSKPLLESYQRWLWRYRKANGSALGISTQRARLGALQRFFAWLCREHPLAATPAAAHCQIPCGIFDDANVIAGMFGWIEITSVFDREQIITPDDIRGDAATLEEAVLAGDAWPTEGLVSENGARVRGAGDPDGVNANNLSQAFNYWLSPDFDLSLWPNFRHLAPLGTGSTQADD